MAYQAGMRDAQASSTSKKDAIESAKSVSENIRGNFSDKEKVKLAKAYLDGAGKKKLMRTFDKAML